MMNDVETTSTLFEVHLVGVPVAIHAEAQEHQDNLRREFAFIAESSDPESTPPRLLRLTQRLRDRFEEFSEGPARRMEEALERGEESIDLVYRVPAEVGPAAAELARLLAEADAYCLTGNGLLTLAAPGRVVAYREWFLGELIRQTDGEEPIPWPEYVSGRPGAPTQA